MFEHLAKRASALAVLAAVFACPVLAQKKVVVHSFDYANLASSVKELFGGPYDLGKGMADLLSSKLKERGLQIVTADADAEGQAGGTVLVFGRAEGRAELGGVGVAGVRVGLGRKQERAAVMLEARLIDVASGQVVETFAGKGEGSRGGMDLAAKFKDVDLTHFDLSSKQFRETALGEATHKAMDELVEGILKAAPRLGTLSAPVASPVVAAPITPASAPATSLGSIAALPAGPWAWTPYQFKGTEHFKYDVKQTQDRQTKAGYYILDIQPAGAGTYRMKVDGKLGDDAYSSTVTAPQAGGGMGNPMALGQLMALGPIGMVLFSPGMSMMFMGQQLSLGDGWSSSNGGKTVSVKAESECQHAGVSGLLAVMRENNEPRQTSCLSPNVALPLEVLMNESGKNSVQMTLIEFRP